MATGFVKLSISIPESDHAVIRKLVFDREADSISAYVIGILERTFPERGRAKPLTELKAEPDWTRVSVYLAPELRDRCTAEVQRQLSSETDKRRKGSLANVAAALVHESVAQVHSLQAA